MITQFRSFSSVGSFAQARLRRIPPHSRTSGRWRRRGTPSSSWGRCCRRRRPPPAGGTLSCAGRTWPASLTPSPGSCTPTSAGASSRDPKWTRWRRRCWVRRLVLRAPPPASSTSAPKPRSHASLQTAQVLPPGCPCRRATAAASRPLSAPQASHRPFASLRHTCSKRAPSSLV